MYLRGKRMYRVGKPLNHNTVIAISMEDQQEYLLIGKGIGFGKKVSERFEIPDQTVCTIYSLQEQTERGKAMELIKGMDPVYLEIAEKILTKSEEVFGKIDRRILFPLADHIAFAVQRIRAEEQISNPLTDDIRVLFHMEYKVAETVKEILREMLQVEIDEHEIGYIALHIHSAIEDENVALSMQIANAVRECIQMIEGETGQKIDILSLSYNRLMNHIRYMVARAIKGEALKLNMNDYMSVKFPKSYEMAEEICGKLNHQIHHELNEAEVGYLAMHIERVIMNE